MPRATSETEYEMTPEHAAIVQRFRAAIFEDDGLMIDVAKAAGYLVARRERMARARESRHDS